ncbi:hypothetical protein DFP72DRAFT_907324 [Ephemerocybe angulata]|uniref:DUF6533 domain-containing protein n=2 Tax=Ephemerocybe angulata TaxID=980116 RepID=A0A8H6M116_9AGAR|nr:hypothetical protein DFP72DRAFT_907324 [Tulosesus angulatus]
MLSRPSDGFSPVPHRPPAWKRMVGSISSPTMEEVLQAYQATRYTSYINTAGFTLVVADYLQTLPDEVHLMWPSPISLPQFLFYFLRYYILVVNTINALYYIPLGRSVKECQITWLAGAFLSAPIVVAAEGMLCYRVYAFSGRNRKIFIYLILQFIVIHMAEIAVLVQYGRTVQFLHFPGGSVTCMALTSSTYLAVLFTLLLVNVISTMVLMIYIAFSKHGRVDSGLVRVFYRDGVFYFIVLSALAIANIHINFLASEWHRYLITQLEVDFHAILATRMLLHLRRYAESEKFVGVIPAEQTGDPALASAIDYSYHDGFIVTTSRVPSSIELTQLESEEDSRSQKDAVGDSRRSIPHLPRRPEHVAKLR